MSGDKKKKLPEGWRWFKLKQLGSLSQGGTPSTDVIEYWNGNYPFITGADVTVLYVSNARSFLTEKGLDSGKTQKCEKGDLLIVSRTRVGRIGIAAITLGISQDVSVLKMNGNYDAKYLAMFLNSISKGLEEACQGATIKGLTRGYIENISIPIPPTPSDQDIIASDLESRMAHVEKMRVAALCQKEAIAAMQGAILREVFPYEEGDELPEGWKWEELGNLFTIEKQQINPFDESFYSLRFIGMENIESNTRKFIPNGNTEESGDSTCLLFDNKHVLYGKLRPYLNKVYLPDKKGRCSTELIPLIPKNGFSRSFITSVLQSEIVVNNAVKHSTGGRMPRADMEKLKKLKVPIPSNYNDQLAITAELERKLSELEKARQTAQRQIEAIEALPGAILREVFDFEEENTGS